VQRLSPHQLGTPDDVASEVLASGKECLLVGDGALRYREVFEGLSRVEIAEEAFAYPSAASLVQLAHAQALREDFVKPWELRPLYLRKPDAEINWAVRESGTIE
jgi:tRNA threonylcarbamoyladenosine biosynthesis protein TsaB